MGIVRRYRLVSLTLLIVGILLLFLGFFFAWVLAPLAVIALAYVGFVMSRPGQRLLARLSKGARWERRQRLVHEARVRNEQLARKVPKISRKPPPAARKGVR